MSYLYLFTQRFWAPHVGVVQCQGLVSGTISYGAIICETNQVVYGITPALDGFCPGRRRVRGAG